MNAEPASRVALALMLMIRHRDPETYAHSMRVAALSFQIARMADLPKEEAQFVRLVGMLHDIGKIAVPEKILHKPESLDEGEWKVMRLHASKGGEILSFLPSLRHLALPVASHHEFFYGNGYPGLLSGEKIPLSARIVAVADAYDAMLVQRAYSFPLPPVAISRELRRCAGSQFDPQVVSWLLKYNDGTLNE